MVHSIGSAPNVSMTCIGNRLQNPISEWGQPFIVASEAFDIRYRCSVCNASWVGPIGDFCEWCHQRWVNDQAARKERLLFPEWLDWGKRYFECSPIDRRVWEETRGIHRDFERTWKRAIFEAVANDQVTGHEASQALKRYQRWKTHMQKSESY